MVSEIISIKYKDLDELSVKKKSDYAIAKPFPHILLDDFFDNSYLEEILNNFPDLSKKKEAYEFKTKTDKKKSKKTVILLESLDFLENPLNLRVSFSCPISLDKGLPLETNIFDQRSLL